MLTIRSPVFFFFLLLLLDIFGVEALPQNQRKKGKGKGKNTAAATPQQQAAQIPQGVSQATDGSTILDMTARVKYVVPYPTRQFAVMY